MPGLLGTREAVKLEGSLDAFSLPDVFQLLSLTKKSGGLHLANGDSAGIVYFASGAITGAGSNAFRQGLARRLVGLGACDDAALRRAVERATVEHVGVARALADSGAVDTDLLNRLAMEQTIDAVFDLLRWPDGEFAFGIDEPNPDEVGLSMTAEQVVAEARTRRETWDAVSRIINSPEVVLTMPVIVETPAVTRDEWALLALVDGKRPIRELVELSGAGQFAVVSTLASMVQRGMLALRDEDSPDHIALVRRRQLLLAPLEGAASPAIDEPQPEPQPIEPQPAPSNDAAADIVDVLAAAAPPQAPLRGAHAPSNVVPPRPEPFLPKRSVDHPEPARTGFAAPSAPAASSPVLPQRPLQNSRPSGGGASSAAAAQPVGESAIERDPTVNRSLMLRLIAGVRGL